ncbi:MAG: hypothetical protein AB1746_04765 [Candidatus Zixiibacteriota bacterium]
MTEESRHNDESQDIGYEKSDVNLKKVLLYGILGIVFLIIVIIFVVDQFTAVKEEIVYEQVLRPESAPLRELRAREVEELGSYKLLNSTDSVYRIPIERAKQLMADEAYRKKTAETGKQ